MNVSKPNMLKLCTNTNVSALSKTNCLLTIRWMLCVKACALSGKNFNVNILWKCFVLVLFNLFWHLLLSAGIFHWRTTPDHTNAQILMNFHTSGLGSSHPLYRTFRSSRSKRFRNSYIPPGIPFFKWRNAVLFILCITLSNQHHRNKVL